MRCWDRVKTRSRQSTVYLGSWYLQNLFGWSAVATWSHLVKRLIEAFTNLCVCLDAVSQLNSWCFRDLADVGQINQTMHTHLTGLELKLKSALCLSPRQDRAKVQSIPRRDLLEVSLKTDLEPYNSGCSSKVHEYMLNSKAPSCSDTELYDFSVTSHHFNVSFQTFEHILDLKNVPIWFVYVVSLQG